MERDGKQRKLELQILNMYAYLYTPKKIGPF